ncbi:SRPBCC family protein [Nitriliruptor alkaliphilus]|uniref:SRPBCC family protein n=1 Tax=Nitriliruptor alkaliphilus TaxID=427918 RepID=UPI0006988774|nr:SRPBCC family protein [Nitriliruptor alkaliphilus]
MATISEERYVSASPDEVYAVVADPALMATLSPECYRVQWLDDATGPQVGARFRGFNRNGVFRWWTTATVTTADPGRRFAYRVSVLGAAVSEWSYDLEPQGEGTLVRESTTDQRSPLFATTSVLGTGVRDREARNRAGMRTTLERLAALAGTPS